MDCGIDKCERPAFTNCNKCRAELCSNHAENCEVCAGILCPNCYRQHACEEEFARKVPMAA